MKNEDLWRALDVAAAPHEIRWHWLKGHAGHADNERCDTLARGEIDQVRKLHTTEQLTALREQFLARRALDAGQGKLL